MNSGIDLSTLSSHRKSARRLSILLVVCFAGYSIIASAIATAQQRAPAKITLNPIQRNISIGQEAQIEIRLLDQYGNSVAADYDRQMTITVTALEGVAMAKSTRPPVKQEKSLAWASINLPKYSDAQQLASVFLKGQSSLRIKVKPERAGVIRIYAESPGLSPFGTTINVDGPAKISLIRSGGTVQLGQETRVEIKLLNYQDKPVSADQSYSLTLTVTTLNSLAEAKRAVNSPPPATTRSLDGQKLTLARNNQAARITGTFPRGSQAIRIRVAAGQPGVLRVFAEGAGLLSNSTIIAAIAQNQSQQPSKSRHISFSPDLEPQWQFAFFRPQVSAVPLFALDIQVNRCESKKREDGSGRDRVCAFQVLLLKSSPKQPAKAPTDLTVVLTKEEDSRSNLRLSKTELVIPKGKPTHNDEILLTTGLTDTVSICAQSVEDGIEKKCHSFKPRVKRATSLDIQPPSSTATANGLHEVLLTVTARDDGQNIQPDDEGWDSRTVFLTHDSSHKLIFDCDNGKDFPQRDRVIIPKDQSSGRCKIYATYHVKDVKVTATSESVNENLDGRKNIQGKAMVSFYFPWKQILLAILGGLTLAFLSKQKWLGLARGAVIGAVCFGLAFFGAIAAREYILGNLPVLVGKLPVDNLLSAYIIGFLGQGLTNGLAGLIANVRGKMSGAKKPGEETSSETTG